MLKLNSKEGHPIDGTITIRLDFDADSINRDMINKAHENWQEVKSSSDPLMKIEAPIEKAVSFGLDVAPLIVPWESILINLKPIIDVVDKFAEVWIPIVIFTIHT